MSRGVAGTGPYSRLEREGLPLWRYQLCKECLTWFYCLRTGRPRIYCSDGCYQERIKARRATRP